MMRRTTRRQALIVALAIAEIGLVDPVKPAAAETPALLRVGVVTSIAGRNSGLPATDRLEPFRRRLATVLQKAVVLAPQPDGRALVAALVGKRVDYAILSASAFAAAEATCHCLEPLAVPRAADGASSWRAVVVVRGDSAARDLAGLKGSTLALPPANAFAARAYALAELARAGLGERDLTGLDGFAGAEDATRAVGERKADAALIWLPTSGADATAAGSAASGSAAAPPRGPLAVLAERRTLPPEGLRPIWQSPPVPHGPHTVRADLPDEWRARLREALLRLRGDDPDAYDAVEPEFGGGFVAVDKAAFDGLIAALPVR